MRSPISPKSNTCPEGADVYVASIRGKVGVYYPGRSGRLPCATGVERRGDERPEVSRGHSRLLDRAEGPNM